MDIAYLLSSPEEKTRRLLKLARLDPLFAPIIDDLEKFGFEITHKYWGRSGSYTPYAVQVPEDTSEETFATAFMAQWRAGEMPAKFQFSTRYGFAMNAHYFLHELMHFHQDMHGLLFTPISALDQRSYIGLTLLCEALAETEAIRSSYRLKQAGHPAAWTGALLSFDWRGLAKCYAADLKSGTRESEAALNIFKHWHSTRQRHYYEHRAAKLYAQAASTSELRSIDLNQAINRLPKDTRPDYLNNTDLEKISTLEHYPNCDNHQSEDLRIVSPPYLWNTLKPQR